MQRASQRASRLALRRADLTVNCCFTAATVCRPTLPPRRYIHHDLPQPSIQRRLQHTLHPIAAAACPRRRRFYRATLSVAAAECIRVSLAVALQVVLDGLFLPSTLDVKDGLCLFDSQPPVYFV